MVFALYLWPVRVKIPREIVRHLVCATLNHFSGEAIEDLLLLG